MSYLLSDAKVSLWRTTPVRISAYFMVAWLCGLIAFNCVVFLGAKRYLATQGDRIIREQAASLTAMPIEGIIQEI